MTLLGRGGGAIGKFDTHLHPHDRVGKFAKTFHVKLVKHSEHGSVTAGGKSRVDAVHVNGQHVGFLRHATNGGGKTHYAYRHGTGPDAAKNAHMPGGKTVHSGKTLKHAELPSLVGEHLASFHPDAVKAAPPQAASPGGHDLSKLSDKDLANHHVTAKTFMSSPLVNDALKAEAKKLHAAAGAEIAKRQGAFDKGKKPLGAQGQDEQAKIPGATAIVRGKAGRWTKLNGKMVHIPHHDEYSRKVGEDTFTSPKGSTAVYKNGVMHNAPRATADKTTLVKPAPIVPNANLPAKEKKGYVAPPTVSPIPFKASSGSGPSAVAETMKLHAAAKKRVEGSAKVERVAASTKQTFGAAATKAKAEDAARSEAPAPGTFDEVHKFPVGTRFHVFQGDGGHGLTITGHDKQGRARTVDGAGVKHVHHKGAMGYVAHPDVHASVPPGASAASYASTEREAGKSKPVHDPYRPGEEGYKKPVTPQIPTSHPLTVALHGELSKAMKPGSVVQHGGDYKTISSVTPTHVTLHTGETVPRSDVNIPTGTNPKTLKGYTGIKSPKGVHETPGGAASPQKGSQADLKPEHAGSGARSSAGRLRNFKSMSDAKLSGAHAQVVHYNGNRDSVNQDHEGEQAVVAELQNRGIAASVGSHWTFKEPAASLPALPTHDLSKMSIATLKQKVAQLPPESYQSKAAKEQLAAKVATQKQKIGQAQTKAAVTAKYASGTSHALGGEVLKPELNSPGRSSAGRMRNYKAMSDDKLATVLNQLTAHGNDPEAMHAAQEEAKKRASTHGFKEAMVEATIEAQLIAYYAGQMQEASDKGAEPFSTSKTSNWVAKAGGLPHYIQHIAHDLMEKRGLDESRAIAMAVGIVKRWARGGGDVKPDTRAAAAKAVAEWEAKKARAHATP